MPIVFRSPKFVRALLPGLCVLLAASAPQAATPTAALTLSGAQRQALERSRLTAAQDSSIAAAREMAVAAGQLPDPVLKFGIDNLPIEGPDRFSISRDFMTMRRIGVMQELTGSDKLQLRAARLEREADKTLAEKAAAVAAIQRDTALAWLERYYAERMASVIGEQIAQARLEIEAAESAYRAGRGSQPDIVMARSAQVMLEDKASEMARRIRTAIAGLARWVGAGADAPLADPPATATIRLDLRALDTDLAHHPQIALLKAQEDIATAEVRLAVANRKADWSVEVNFQQRASYPNMLSIGLSIPLQWDQTSRQDREVRAKQALVEQAIAQKDDALRAHAGEVRVMLNEWDNGRERQGRYQRELIPLAHERSDALLAAYRGGKASLVDVLAGRRGEIEVQLQALQLEADTARLWAQLNFLFPDDGTAGQSLRHKDMQ